MKTIFSILFILITHFLIGQDEPRLSKYVELFSSNGGDSYRTVSISKYKYDASGNPIEIIKNEFGQNGEISDITGKFYEYTSDNKLSKEISKIYNEIGDEWITQNSLVHVYDVNGCLVEESYIRNLEDTITKTTYERVTDCQLTGRESWVKDNSTDSLELKEIVEVIYPGDSVSYRELHYWEDAMGNLNFGFNKDFIHYPDGRIHRIFKWRNTPDSATYLKEYTYDQYDNFLSWVEHYKTYVVPTPPGMAWIGIIKYFEIREYDEDGKIIEMNVHQYDGDLNYYYRDKNYKYEYDCEKEKVANLRIKDFDNMFYQAYYRFESYYEEEGECADSKEDDFKIDVFPNPTTGEITIYSDLYYLNETTDTQIRIIDMSGKLVLEKWNKGWIGFQKLNLESLPNGVYNIQLLNDETFVQEKIVVAK